MRRTLSTSLTLVRSAAGIQPSPLHQSGRRNILTMAAEVPRTAKIERPYTVVLAEDIGLFDDGPEQTTVSWAPLLHKELPNDHGIAFRLWRPSSSTPATLKETLFEMERDFANMQHELVLVARGPILSWLATFYLEDMSAAGMILVDPLAFADEQLSSLAAKRRFMDEYLQYQRVKYPLRFRHQRVLDYLEDEEGWDDVLTIEAGSVQMAVISTMHIRNSWKLQAFVMAARHSSDGGKDTDNPEVPVVGLQGPNDPALVKAISTFCINRARPVR